MPRSIVSILALSAVMLLAIPCGAQVYDIAILNGRVIDPETKLDAIRNVGISDGRIAVITKEAIVGKRNLDARHHIVAPGFYAFVHSSVPIAAPQLHPSKIRESNLYPPSEHIIDHRTGNYFKTDALFFTTQKQSPDMLVSIRVRNPEWIDQWDDSSSKSAPDHVPAFLGANDETLPIGAPLSAYITHPQNMATASRILRQAREQGIPLADILYNLSYAPAKHYAQVLGYTTLAERGRIQEGMIADVTIFDPNTVRESPSLTQSSPDAPLIGMPYVIVAGELLFDKGRPSTNLRSDEANLDSRATARDIAKMEERQMSKSERGADQSPTVKHHGLAGVMQLHGMDGCCDLPRGFGFRRDF